MLMQSSLSLPSVAFWVSALKPGANQDLLFEQLWVILGCSRTITVNLITAGPCVLQGPGSSTLAKGTGTFLYWDQCPLPYSLPLV